MITYEDINIVYEDNHLLVVVKPQNLPVCEDATGDIDLLRLLKEYLRVTYSKPGEAFLGLVHRLDRPTGGVMVFAKTTKAAARLQASMEEGEFEKKYFAVVCGRPRDNQKTLINYLLKNPANNNVIVVPAATEGAKKAELEYKVLADKNGLSLVDIRLITGRSHQARVQMATIGTPIFGDIRYGKGKTPEGYKLALWAVELRFPHPVSGEKLVFRVFPPEEEVPWSAFDLSIYLSVSIKN